MMGALRSRAGRASPPRAAVIAGAVLVTAALLALAFWRSNAGTEEPDLPAAPAATVETPAADPATASPAAGAPAATPSPAAASPPSPTAAATPAPEPPALVSISPEGLVPRLATITLAFPEPPPEADAARFVSIEPPVEGSFAWVDERTLLFQPAWPGWLRGQRYEVLVKAAGTGLPDDEVHAFTVEGQLEVAYVIPAEGDREVPANAQILVQFNRSVAALTVLQEGPGPDVLEIDPPLEGRGEWLNTSLYRFIPAALAPSTEYRVRIPAGLTSAADGVLLEDHEWSFRTIGPAVTSVWPGPNSRFVELDTAVVIAFNQPMSRASVEAGVTFRESFPDDSRKEALDPFAIEPGVVPVRYRWNEDGSVVTLEPIGELDLSTSYEVAAPAGLQGAAGWATPTGLESQFRTVDYPRLVRTRPGNGATARLDWYYNYYCECHDIDLEYNNPMDGESFEGRVSVSGIDEEDIWISSSGGRWVAIGAPLEYSTSYTVTIAEGARDRGGRVLPAYEFSFTTQAPPPPSRRLQFSLPGRFLTYSASADAEVYFHSRSYSRVLFKLHPLTDSEAVTLIGRGYFDTYGYDSEGRRILVPFVPSLPERRSWWEEIPEEKRDTLQLYSTSLGEGEPLPRGDYLLYAAGERYVISVVDTAIVTKQSYDQLLVWALDYETGRPLAGEPVAVARKTATTDADGLAQVYGSYGRDLVRLTSGGRHGVATTDWQQGSEPWQLDIPVHEFSPRLRGHLYTDRPIYRPGETVSFKGVVRFDDDAAYSLPSEDPDLLVRVRDPRYAALPDIRVRMNDLGTVAGSFVLPEDAPTGTYYLSLAGENGGITRTSFTVAEFRVPEFRVEVEVEGAHFIDGETIPAEAIATFFFGGAVGEAHVDWAALASPAPFSVAGYRGYSFHDYDIYHGYYGYYDYYGQAIRSQGSARTDAAGVARFDVPAGIQGHEGPQLFTISATVTDANAQAVAGSANVTVHPARWYAGIRPESYVARAGEPTTVHLVTADVEANIAPNRPVTVRAIHREWVTTKERTSRGRRYYSTPVETEIETWTVTTGADGEAGIEFTPPEAGTFRLVAESVDEEGRVARSSRFLWASGTQWARWRIRTDDTIELIADRERYEVGDVAEVLVPAPFPGATALVTVERGRILSREVRAFETNSEVLRIPIEDHHVPNVYVGVVLYRPPTDEDPLPRYHVGYVELPVSTASRELEVRIEPERERAVPGETVRYEVEVTDWLGRGVEAEVSVAIVDEAVLSLADEVGPDGMAAFWFQRALGVYTASSLSVSVNRTNDVISEPEEESIGKGAGADPRVRSDFRHTALWIGQLTTDANGRASFELDLPDNATTWRAQARAVSGARQFGESTSELLVTQPLLVRPALPRFLRVGDEVTLRTLVRNGTASARDVNVTLAAEGVVLEDGGPLTARIAPDGSTMFEWPARVVEAGAATVRFSAVATGGHGDAVELSIPVHLDVTPETTATGGVVDGAVAVEAVYLPDYVIPDSGSLELSLQASLVGAIEGELRYLRPPPPWKGPEGYERIASRVIATVAVERSKGSLTSAQSSQLRADLTALVSGQRYDGGWAWCRKHCRTNLWVTAWVLVALGEARDAGHAVPAHTLTNTSRLFTSHVNRWTDYERPPDPNQHAFLLYGLARGGAGDTSSAAAGALRALVEQDRSKLTNWARAYAILGLLATGHEPEHQAVRALLNDLTAATIASANGNHWEDERHAGSMHGRPVRSTALVLRALTEAAPRHPLIEETARWLVLARSDGRWETTVERAQGMASLGAFAHLTGENRGVYDYRVLLNTAAILEGAFNVPAGDYRDGTEIALEELPPGEISRVQFQRDASREGRLYYTLNLRYVTPAQEIEALNRGFAVSHRYTLLDDPDTPITSAPLGAVVRVTVTVLAPHERLFTKVEDPLPAGLEPIDPRLNIVPPELRLQLEQDRRDAYYGSAPRYFAPWYAWYYNPWIHVDIRDDRLTLLATRLPKGVHEYVYYARATTPGDFFVAPAYAEETYFPEVFGRGDSSRFTIHEAE